MQAERCLDVLRVLAILVAFSGFFFALLTNVSWLGLPSVWLYVVSKGLRAEALGKGVRVSCRSIWGKATHALFRVCFEMG